MMKCQIDKCTDRAEMTLLGVRMCWLHFLRVKVRAALDHVHVLAA